MSALTIILVLLLIASWVVIVVQSRANRVLSRSQASLIGGYRWVYKHWREAEESNAVLIRQIERITGKNA